MLRGLQGSYNALAAKYGFTIPYGAVWLFSIACSQIMYGFTLRPDTLPRAYISWIDQAGQIPPKAIAINRDLTRKGGFKISDIDQLISNPVHSSVLSYTYLTHVFIALGTTPEKPDCATSPPSNGNRISAKLR